MMNYLKIKIESLKNETRVIRRHEDHELIQARQMSVHLRLLQSGLSDIQRSRIINRAARRGVFRLPPPDSEKPRGNAEPRRKGKRPYFDLAGRAQIITSIVAGVQSYLYPGPKQSWIDDHRKRFDGLRLHRINEVRPEARAAHLAYGFLRGVPYKAMEQKSYSPPPWQTTDVQKGIKPCPIERMALRFGEHPQQDIKQRLAEWKDAAGVWMHPDYQPNQSPAQVH